MEISNSHLLLCSAHIDLFGLVCDNYKEMICKGSGFLKNKNTNDLKQEIAKSEDLSQFLRKNEGNFLNTDIPTALSALCNGGLWDLFLSLQRAECSGDVGIQKVSLIFSEELR